MQQAAREGAFAASLDGWRERLAYRSILEATADKGGEEFLRHLVQQLAGALEVSHAFVAEFAGRLVPLPGIARKTPLHHAAHCGIDR